MIDAKGQRTRWERDLQGRPTREVRADDSTARSFTYESTTSRLKTVTDPKGQITTYSHGVDDMIQAIAFSNATVATPSVSYSYDAAYQRVTTMTDGIGSTTFTYKATGMLGAGQVASVDGPLANDTIIY